LASRRQTLPNRSASSASLSSLSANSALTPGRNSPAKASNAPGRRSSAEATPLSTTTYVTELQRDWARQETAGTVKQIFE